MAGRRIGDAPFRGRQSKTVTSTLAEDSMLQSPGNGSRRWSGAALAAALLMLGPTAA
jgi:hypothetical protein